MKNGGLIYDQVIDDNDVCLSGPHLTLFGPQLDIFDRPFLEGLRFFVPFS